MNTAVRPSAPIVSERGTLGGGNRLEPPVRRRLQVLRGCDGTPSNSSLPSQTSSGSGIPMAFLESFQRREHEPADRGEIVPALLYDDDRQPGSADMRPASRKPRRNVERALGSPPAASTPSASTSASAPLDARRLHEHRHGPQPLVIPRSRWQREVEIRAEPRTAAALGLAAEEVREPAGRRIDVHRGREDVVSLPEDRLGAVPVMSVDVDDRDPRRAPVAQVLRRDGGVVEIARAAVGACA